MSDDAKSDAASAMADTEGGDIMALGATEELAAHAKTAWMLNIIGFGLLYLIFVEKSGQWKNPWFVSQVRAMMRCQLLMMCWPIGAFFSFKAMGAIGKNKDPKLPFAAPEGFASSQQ